MSNVEAANTQAGARPLTVLVPLIKDEIAAGNEAALEHHRRAGAMLLEAKEQIGPGDWAPWLRRCFHLSAGTARDYERLAPRRPFVRPPRPSVETARTIPNPVNMGAIAAHERNREHERRQRRAIKRELIDAGYKVLAQNCTPTRGARPRRWRD